MDKMEFATRIAEEVGKRMPDATVSVNEVLKNNRTLTGITIKSDNSNIAPTIYVDEFYGGGYTLNLFRYSPFLGYQIIWWNGLFGFGAGFTITWSYYFSGRWQKLKG